MATTLSRDASPARALAWTADWNQRSDLSPRALLAAVALLRRAGRDREAATLSLRALGADPTADGVAEHRLWLLADRCGHPEGDLAPATEIRRDTVHGDLHRALHALLLAVHGWGSDAAPAPDAAARQLQGVVASYGTPLPRALQRLVWRAVGRAARSRGGPLGWVWVLSAAWKARRAAPA